MTIASPANLGILACSLKRNVENDETKICISCGITFWPTFTSQHSLKYTRLPWPYTALLFLQISWFGGSQSVFRGSQQIRGYFEAIFNFFKLKE
jgi:hypothetical protein